MRTPRFWYSRSDERLSRLKAGLLSPLAFAFKAGTRLRRLIAKPYVAKVPVVVVGNVVVGGSGKTPTALALAQILKERGHKPVFVTRGYGGKGVLTCVNPERDKAADVGDEPLLLAAAAPTWAGRDRAAAVREAQANGSIVIMDDGMQNPHVAPTASILVVDGETGLGNGRILPAGPLREPFADALRRASAMIIVGPDRHNLGKQARIPVFHAHLEPKISPAHSGRGRFVAFAGIAHPENFFATARKARLDLANYRDFPDHYVYKEADIEALRLEAEVQGARLLTTEKDAVRLPPEFRAEVVVLPARLVFDTVGAEKALIELIAARKR